jgi:hypothetical protein
MFRDCVVRCSCLCERFGSCLKQLQQGTKGHQPNAVRVGGAQRKGQDNIALQAGASSTPQSHPVVQPHHPHSRTLCSRNDWRRSMPCSRRFWRLSASR